MEDDRPRSEKKILAALDDARDAVREYDYELMMAGWDNSNPANDPQVFEAKVIMHIAVMRAFDRLRAQIQEHLSPTYWHEAVIFRRPERGQLIRGIKALEQFQGRVFPHEVEEKASQAAPQKRTEWEVQLMPADAYRRTVELFGECVQHLGYVEAPSPPRTIHLLDSQGGEGDAFEENGYERPDENVQEAEVSIDG